VVTGVYAARETEPEGFSLREVAAAVAHPAVYTELELDAVSDFLILNVNAGDVVIVFSAGDATKVSAALFQALQSKEAVS
jgi:UDP-N-acetylmuramate--alanine ligase